MANAPSTTTVDSVSRGRALFVSRVAMGIYVCAVCGAILVRDPRYILAAGLFALIQIIAGPGRYRFIGIFGVFGALIAFFLIECL